MMKKRNLILIVLVLALGAAVYLNWQLAPEIVTADDVAGQSSEYEADETLGEAKFVDAQQDESVSDLEAESTGKDYFTQAKLSRENTHNDAMKELEEIINNSELDDSTKAAAVSKAAELAETMKNETNIENLIKAKGFDDVLVTVGENQTTVVIKSDGLSANEVAIIKDVIVSQLGIPASSVKIIETE